MPLKQSVVVATLAAATASTAMAQELTPVSFGTNWLAQAEQIQMRMMKKIVATLLIIFKPLIGEYHVSE